MRGDGKQLNAYEDQKGAERATRGKFHACAEDDAGLVLPQRGRAVCCRELRAWCGFGVSIDGEGGGKPARPRKVRYCLRLLLQWHGAEPRRFTALEEG